MFKKFYVFIKRLFVKQSVIINDASTNDDSILEQPIVVFSSDENLINPAYLHTKKRIHERYGHYISENLYNEWIESIKTNKATFVKKAQGSANIYTMPLGYKNILVVFDYEKNLILTALPYNPQAIQQVNKNKKTKGKASKNVGRGILN